MSKKKLIRFNIKNVKYSLKESEKYGVPKDLAYAEAISLEANYDETKIYGDGQVIGIIADDQGQTGTLTVVTLSDEYETDMGRALKIGSGLASIRQIASVPHAIYFEVDYMEDGVTKTLKNWLLNVTTGKANETYTQNKDNPTVNNYEYSLNILGEKLLDSTGAKIYTDTNGNEVTVFKITSAPADVGYATFGDKVPEVKAVGA